MSRSLLSRSCLRIAPPTHHCTLASATRSCFGTFRTAIIHSEDHSTSQSILDFLIPSHRHSSAPTNRSPSRTLLPPNQRRSFSSTRVRHAAVLNPRKDEDGKDMNVLIAPRAAHVSHISTFRIPKSHIKQTNNLQRLRDIMKSDSNPNLLLRVTVESGGCHGFQYLMSLTDMNTVSQEEDTIFEADDGTGAKVVMDEPSLELLKGSKIDYTMELIGSQFKIVDNPLATSSCGCGTSFDIKA